MVARSTIAHARPPLNSVCLPGPPIASLLRAQPSLFSLSFPPLSSPSIPHRRYPRSTAQTGRVNCQSTRLLPREQSGTPQSSSPGMRPLADHAALSDRRPSRAHPACVMLRWKTPSSMVHRRNAGVSFRHAGQPPGEFWILEYGASSIWTVVSDENITLAISYQAKWT
jgi:hypothetical protein